MTFEPIAIVGQGCTLPGALDPDQLWAAIQASRVNLTKVDPQQWRLPPDWAELGAIATIPGIGGFVRGFDDVFDAHGFAVSADEIRSWDRPAKWMLHAGRHALGDDFGRTPSGRTGLIIGSLGYPSPGQAAFAEHVWQASLPPRAHAIPSTSPADPRLRFCSSLPVSQVAEALGVDGEVIALDAACASSLYAIKLACDRLQARSADRMLAGGVSGSDGLLIHLGFTGLAALSPSGRSRPFDRHADGLVPAEGAALLTLMRHDDAVRQDRAILGVIRGIGLANDGAAGGFLSPATAGQQQAMRAAYHGCGIDPATVTLLECHATGTAVGDAVELTSANAIFTDSKDLPLGSAKGNLGHLLTAAGAAAVLKVLAAMQTGIRPMSVGAADPVAELLCGPLRLLQANEDWPTPRRAAISAFGFGGNNAHLILDAPDLVPRPHRRARALCSGDAVAVVAIGARIGAGQCLSDMRDSLLTGVGTAVCTAIDIDVEGLRFPPNDLRVAPGQSLVLEAAREAAGNLALPGNTMVVIGMETDPEAVRPLAGARHACWAAHHGSGSECEVNYGADFSAAHGIGAMANIFANRIGSQFDLTGPAFAVSAGEASGVVAMTEAAAALQRREVDAAIVGAVDLSVEPVHTAALRSRDTTTRPGDGAIALVLQRAADARRAGNPIWALLDSDAGPADLALGPGTAFDPADVFGSPHAAQGIMAVAAGVLALRHRAQFRVGAPADPAMRAETVEIVVPRTGAHTTTVRLRRGDRSPGITTPPQVHVFSGTDIEDVLDALANGRTGLMGPARLAVVAAWLDEAVTQVEAARRWLQQGGLRPPGMAFHPEPVGGDTAFVFTNGSAAAPRMGRNLLLAMPGIVDNIEARFGDDLSQPAGWAYRDTGTPGGSLDQIQGVTVLAAVQAALTRDLLGINPSAAIGYSSGESTALVVTGAWTQPHLMYSRFRASELFSRDLGGELRAVRAAWAQLGVTGHQWSTYLVNADAERIRTVLRDRPAVHLMTINSPDTCVIGGESEACSRILAELGDVVAIRVDYDLAAHAPELSVVAKQWYDLHLAPTQPVPGVRFYNGATGQPYDPTPERAAQAITDQGMGTIDFVALIERAYADGIRIFIEHGPAGMCTGWIKRILGDRSHVAVALDPRPDDALTGFHYAVAELAAAGVELNLAALAALLRDTATPRPSRSRLVTVATAHRAPIRASAGPAAETMIPPPPRNLEPILDTVFEPTLAAPISASGDTRRSVRIGALITAHHQLLAAEHARHLTLFAESQAQYLSHQDRIIETLCTVSARAHSTTSTPTLGDQPVTRTIAVDTLDAPPYPPGSPKPAQTPQRDAVMSVAGHPGPRFDRSQLEYLATGAISALFGPAFAVQDNDVRQTRMPTPPILLADRVTGIDAEPATLGTGTIWTQTDIHIDSWYLDYAGRIPPCLLIEAGQADLLLISWLGVDLTNRSRRVYRLLGSEAIFHTSPPGADTRLDYEIRIVDHAAHGAQRLFFFEYDCLANGQPQLSIRRGQAGYFTDEELAMTAGVLWDPSGDAPDGSVDPVPLVCDRTTFGADDVAAFAAGRPTECFGRQWDATRAHVRTPRISDGQMLLLGQVTAFDIVGGPWARGYLRAETSIHENDWFFAGHFQNDPCMPGTLMLDGCIQAMSFYLAATGFTVDRDGWRFEPVPERPYSMRCRGQVTPASRAMRYEVFVSALSATPYPTLQADVLVTVDQVKAVHVRNLCVRLVPDYPLDHWQRMGRVFTQKTGDPVRLAALGGLVGHHDRQPVADIAGFKTGYASLLACAWGPSSQALGPAGRRFDDGLLRGPRLPGPPYHFMTRVCAVDGPYAGFAVGSSAIVEYDVPDAAWYFAENPAGVMPLSVLMEVVLQPCGWLSAYAGTMLRSDIEIFIRNLDGDVVVTAEVASPAHTISTRVELLSISELNGMILESFRVDSHVDGKPLLHGTTTFGHFSTAALAEQIGIPPTREQRDAITHHTVCIPARRRGMPGPMLLMLSRISVCEPDGGSAGLGRIVSDKVVDAGEWFFKAHFFQDPVMPGSLGVEAVAQAVQWLMLACGLDRDIEHPRFEAVAVGQPLRWKYRGQVTPADTLVTVEADIVELVDDAPRSRTAFAQAWLWVDGRRIYHLPRIGIRITAGPPPSCALERLDLTNDSWLSDHRPTYTTATLPMMSIVDRICQAAVPFRTGSVTVIPDITLRRWIPVASTALLRTEVERHNATLVVTLSVWHPSPRPELSQFEPVTTAEVGDSPAVPPQRFAPLRDAYPAPTPYSTGETFHGPAFHYLTDLRIGDRGATAVLDAAKGTVPSGHLPQGLLDAMTHAVPHTRLETWSDRIQPGHVGFPQRIRNLTIYEAIPPDGLFTVEARFTGFDGEDPEIDLQLLQHDRVLLTMTLIDRLGPLGGLGPIDHTRRRAFARDRDPADGAGLSSTRTDGITVLRAADTLAWASLPGTLEHVYALPTDTSGDRVAIIAMKEHTARRAGVHPSSVLCGIDTHTCWVGPRRYPLTVTTTSDGVEVRDAR
jgi:acyl transferase domain-containing protein/3-hydroxymyristoyl/3-hydroxydecanoyl-(acyl carrier protein) dehydratase